MQFFRGPRFRPPMFYLWALCALALGLATTGGCRKAPVPPPFDVPALIGLPIEALTQRMGAPDAANPGAPNPNQRTWTRNGATLTATFKPVSGRVTSLEMIARPAADAVRDGEQEKLLQAGRLSQSDARYSVDWIEAPERPLFYNGVKITPAPRTYQVQLRVTGSAELLQVSYQMSGATPPGAQFLTIAPWDVTATLSDDATIQLSAQLAQGLTLSPTPMLVEIVVDGKVVASKKASVIATCQWEL